MVEEKNEFSTQNFRKYFSRDVSIEDELLMIPLKSNSSQNNAISAKDDCSTL